MMDYLEFQGMVKELLQELLGNEVKVQIVPVPKNNGIILDGLCIVVPGGDISPVIYLNSYYQQYCSEVLSVPDTVEDILKIFRENQYPDFACARQLTDFSKVKDKIMFKVINRDKNNELLQTVPFDNVLDLAMVFYLMLDKDKNGQMTALIRNSHMELWDVTTAEIKEVAFENTKRELPAKIRSMQDVLKDELIKNLGIADVGDLLETCFGRTVPEPPMYVLTNTADIYGAGCMLYPEILREFSESLGQDLIILPSSTHEVLLIPDNKEMDYKELSDMVTHINQTEVSEEDQLSDKIYRYSRLEDRTELIEQNKSEDSL